MAEHSLVNKSLQLQMITQASYRKWALTCQPADGKITTALAYALVHVDFWQSQCLARSLILLTLFPWQRGQTLLQDSPSNSVVQCDTKGGQSGKIGKHDSMLHA